MAIIITVSNQKGGVGKTTTSAALATGISSRGRRVLGIDLDPQGNLGFCLGLGSSDMSTVLDALKGKLPIQEAIIPVSYTHLDVYKRQVQVARMIDVEPLNSCIHLLQMAFQLILKVCMVFIIVAFFDFLYQRWEYEKNLKMTKQEVKDEYKQTEGNPEIKGRIRRIQRQMALSRMIQKVPEADVIVRNPTHFAVALKYDPKRHGAPVVLAKGQDELALRIVKAGEENGVFMIENKPLARALYASCRLDQEIPAEFYGAVAEILIYIYRASHREDMFQ